MITVDMGIARDIWRAKIRAERDRHFKDLDVAYQRADEIGDAVWKADIVSQKNVLRDAPAAAEIEAANTPEELKAFWPFN